MVPTYLFWIEHKTILLFERHNESYSMFNLKRLPLLRSGVKSGAKLIDEQFQRLLWNSFLQVSTVILLADTTYGIVSTEFLHNLVCFLPKPYLCLACWHKVLTGIVAFHGKFECCSALKFYNNCCKINIFIYFQCM